MKIIVTFCSIFVISNAKECIIKDDLRAKNLATKTPYDYVLNSDVKVDFPEDCSPLKFWMVSRHGTRFPSKPGIKAINEILPKLIEKANLCQEDIEKLKKWQPEIVLEDAKKLHPEGEKELILMGERFQQRFPHLLSQDYHPENFKFRATNTQRAQSSQFHFAVGLFGRKEAYKVTFEDPILPYDPIIRFYKGCEKWQKSVKHNSSTLLQQKLFEKSTLFTQNVQEKLSKLFEHKLELEEIDAIWVACTFGQAWQPQKLSPWCAILEQEQRNLLEFRENLEYFYVDSYGHPINYKQSCVLAEDILQQFFNPKENVTLYFTHSGTLLKFLAYLNLDPPNTFPRHDNYGQVDWTTSKIDTFANNIAFVLLSCDKVAMFVNEKLTKIPNCDEYFCDIVKFKSIFGPNCDFIDICGNDTFDFGSEDDRF